jgi:putative transposase
MDEDHLLARARYVELNPVRAGLVAKAQDWRWSSARAHLEGQDDGLATVRPLRERVPDWPALLASGLSEDEHSALRRGERTGRPLGAPAFVQDLERRLGRPLAPRAPGRKPKLRGPE